MRRPNSFGGAEDAAVNPPPPTPPTPGPPVTLLALLLLPLPVLAYMPVLIVVLWVLLFVVVWVVLGAIGPWGEVEEVLDAGEEASMVWGLVVVAGGMGPVTLWVWWDEVQGVVVVMEWGGTLCTSYNTSIYTPL